MAQEGGRFICKCKNCCAKRFNPDEVDYFFMKLEKILEVCPVCGSADLYYEAGGYTGKIYHCKNCDYMGALIVEADEEMAGAIKDDFEHKKHTA